MSLSAKHLMFGAALVLSGSPLFAAETAANAVVAASPRAYVNCPGISNVPMTATRSRLCLCARRPSWLAASRSPCSRITKATPRRSAPWTEKVGYVARMYLTAAATGLTAGNSRIQHRPPTPRP